MSCSDVYAGLEECAEKLWLFMATSFVNKDRSVTQAVLWLSSTEVKYYNELEGDGGGHFGIATQHVGQAHLLDCLAVDIE